MSVIDAQKDRPPYKNDHDRFAPPSVPVVVDKTWN
jgi:hypothetical protein